MTRSYQVGSFYIAETGTRSYQAGNVYICESVTVSSAGVCFLLLLGIGI